MMCTNVPQSCTNVQRASGLRRRADQPEIAPGADLRRGPWLEVLAENPIAHLEHDALDPLEVVRGAADRDLLVSQHVPVAAGRPFEAPGFAGGEPVDRELDVRLELALWLGVAGLVVDQLVAPARQLVDAVDAAPQMVGADPEVELALDPAWLGAARHLAGVI